MWSRISEHITQMVLGLVFIFLGLVVMCATVAFIAGVVWLLVNTAFLWLITIVLLVIAAHQLGRSILA